MLSRLLMLISVLCLTCFSCFGQFKQERIPDSVIVALVNEEFEWPLRGFSREYYYAVLDDNMKYVRFSKEYDYVFGNMLSYFEVDSIDEVSFFEQLNLNRENDSFELKLSTLDGLSRKVKKAMKDKKELTSEALQEKLYKRMKIDRFTTDRFMIVSYSLPIKLPDEGGYILIKRMLWMRHSRYEAIYMLFDERRKAWYADRFFWIY